MKRFHLISYALIISYLLLAAACFPPFEPKETGSTPDTVPVVDTSRQTPELPEPVVPQKLISEQAVMATLFQQRSAEYEALCYQAFNLARILLERDLRDDKVIMPRAIIVDIDETMLDNSPHSAKCIENETSYPDYWDEWCKLAKAKAVPGAVEFMKHARNYGITLYYITNRKENLKEATMKNMRDLGFPQVEEKNFMFRTTESGKESRRQLVAKNHHITMLIGDNLNDFSEAFENTSVAERAIITEKMQREFGRRFIVLPNPMYGDWEGALYNYKYSITDSAKMALRRQWLESF